MRKYKFKLQNASTGITTLAYPPDGWDENKVIYQRRLTNNYFGVFRKRTASVLNFIKNGKDIAEQVLADEGMEGNLEFIVEKLNYANYEYEEEFRGVFDFSTFKSTEEGFEVQIIDSAIEQRLFNREKLKVNLLGEKSVDDFILTGFTNEGIEIVLPQREDVYFNTLNGSEGIASLPSPSAVNLQAETQEDDDIKEVTDTTAITTDAGAFFKATYEKTVYVYGSGNLSSIVVTGSGNFKMTLRRFASSVLQEEIEVVNEAITTGTVVEYSYSESMLCAEYEYLIMVVEVTGVTGVLSILYSLIQDTRTTIRIVPKRLIKGIMFNEAVTRCLQMILSVDDPLYSPAIGREDSESRAYAEDGYLSQGFITNGELIRGFEYRETELSASFLELFGMLYAIGNVGVAIETIEGAKKVVIRSAKDFFRNFIILEIDNAKDITREAFPDLIFNKVTSGYKKSDYEEKDGRLEYNNKTEYSVPITTFEKTLNIVSPIRADNKGITSAQLKTKREFPTEDTTYDEQNFIINVAKGTNEIINGLFSAWTGNIPDGWTVPTGGMLEAVYLGKSRCRFNSVTPAGFVQTASLTQSIPVLVDEEVTVSFAYKFITEIPTLSLAGVRINLGTYGLKEDGSWVNGWMGSLSMGGLQMSITEAELQSFDSFYIVADPCPVSGNLSILVTAGKAGLVVDNFQTGESLKARTSEGFDSVTGTVDDGNTFNVGWSPARNLIKYHGWLLRTGLEKQLGKTIAFTNAEKNSSMVSKETGETSISENSDIPVSSLEPPLMSPFVYTMESEITQTIIDTIEGTTEVDGEDIPNFYGIVKFRKNSLDSWKYGWIKKLNTQKDGNLGEWELIEVNTDYVTPTDPTDMPSANYAILEDKSHIKLSSGSLLTLRPKI